MSKRCLCEERQLEPLAVPVDEAAKILGISRSFLYQKLREGALPRPFKCGNRTLFAVSQLRRYVDRSAMIDGDNGFIDDEGRGRR